MEGFTDDSIEKEIKIALDNEKGVVGDLRKTFQILIEKIKDKEEEIKNLGFDPNDIEAIPAFVQDKKHEMTNEEWDDLLAQHDKLVWERKKLIEEKNTVNGDIHSYINHQEN